MDATLAPMTADEQTPAELAPEPFDDFYRREYRPMVALAWALTGERTAAEDVTQDAFVAAHRAWPRVSRYDRPGAWLRRVVVNRSRSAFRRTAADARARRRLGGELQRPTEPLPEDSTRFWALVRSLPKRQAQCIALRYVDDLTVAEIAGVLGCAEATVRVHLHRARSTLAERLRADHEVS